MRGLVGYAAYLPYWRLQRAAIRDALGTAGGSGRGLRSVASYDEDTTTMAVESGRLLLRSLPKAYRPGPMWFATSAPGYLDKSNAAVVHAALRLEDSVGAFDAVGGVSSSLGASEAAQHAGGIAIVSDIRTGLPGSADEADGGDAAVALAYGDGAEIIAQPLGSAVSMGEFLDRWRVPGSTNSKVWEERFGEHAYAPHVERALDAALKHSDTRAEDLDHVVITGLNERAVRQARHAVGARPAALSDSLVGVVGNTGAAHWALVLADVLDHAKPGETIAVLTLSAGAHVQLWRTTEALAEYLQLRTVRGLIDRTRTDLGYLQFLAWRGLLQRELPRRPEPDRPAAPPSLRSAGWKFAFVGTHDETGYRHLPPARVSLRTHSIDQMTPEAMADIPGTIATFTVDRLAYSPSPPLVAAVVDFDGGGRFPCELTDVDAASVHIGDRVEMTFRRLHTQDGVHNYFWKARPRIETGETKAG